MEQESINVNGLSKWDNLNKGYVDYVDSWLLMSSLTTPLVIVSVYLLFVLKIGPVYMKNRPAYSLRNILHIYNSAQVFYSIFLVYKGGQILREEGLLEKKCMLQDNEYTYKIAFVSHCYLLAKLSELLDTIFFVLRKKWNQISFLHLYHHTIMFFGTWIALKYMPTSSWLFMGTLNSFVHVIMYTYYGLSAFPGLTKFLWWKSYITQLQLIQFAFAITNLTINFFQSKCTQYVFILFFNWANFILFTYLFAKFYIESYKKNKQTSNRTPVKDEAGFQGRFKKTKKQKLEGKSI